MSIGTQALIGGAILAAAGVAVFFIMKAKNTPEVAAVHDNPETSTTGAADTSPSDNAASATEVTANQQPPAKKSRGNMPPPVPPFDVATADLTKPFEVGDTEVVFAEPVNSPILLNKNTCKVWRVDPLKSKTLEAVASYVFPEGTPQPNRYYMFRFDFDLQYGGVSQNCRIVQGRDLKSAGEVKWDVFNRRQNGFLISVLASDSQAIKLIPKTQENLGHPTEHISHGANPNHPVTILEATHVRSPEQFNVQEIDVYKVANRNSPVVAIPLIGLWEDKPWRSVIIKPKSSSEPMNPPEKFPVIPKPKSPIAAAREAARRVMRLNQLKQIGIGMHNYHETYGSFPSASKNGLSWRVHLLPYVDAAVLYNRFHLDEPWDSEHNKQLIKEMPPIYLTPGEKNSAKTSIHVFTSPGSVFAESGPGVHVDFAYHANKQAIEAEQTYSVQVTYQKEGKRKYANYRIKGSELKERGVLSFTFENASKSTLRSIINGDGSSNTLMAVYGGPECADTWTKPGGLPFYEHDPVAVLGSRHESGIPVLFVDGAATTVPTNIDAKTFGYMIQKNDGQRINLR